MPTVPQAELLRRGLLQRYFTGLPKSPKRQRRLLRYLDTIETRLVAKRRGVVFVSENPDIALRSVHAWLIRVLAIHKIPVLFTSPRNLKDSIFSDSLEQYRLVDVLGLDMTATPGTEFERRNLADVIADRYKRRLVTAAASTLPVRGADSLEDWYGSEFSSVIEKSMDVVEM